MNQIVKKPSKNTVKNITLWVGILTALVLIVVAFLQGTTLSEIPSSHQPDYQQALEQFRVMTSALVNSLKQLQL